MSADLHFLTIADAAQLIRARKLSPVELTEACIDRVRALDGSLHAFIRLLADSALAEAKVAEAEIAAGRWKGPLHGIPIGLKDIYNTAGIATTGHSALFRDHVPDADATTVRLLRAAGAIVLGKLSTMEFAIGGPSFDLPWPPARNPWDLERQPGGSSSGSGVAIATGLCIGAMGTDTGGSIRNPAAWCGIAGIKPTYGRVSRHGILPLSFTMDHGGPMCWTSEDCALMMQVLSGHDPLDPGSADEAVPDFAAAIGAGISGLRIGVIRHFFERDLAPAAETGAALEAALPVLQKLGATVQDVTLSPLQVFGDVGTLISRAEAYALHERYLTTTPELYGASGRGRLMAGAFVRGADYVNALRHRTRLVAEIAEAMREVDVLIVPTVTDVAPKFENDPSLTFGASYTRPFNVTGNPALSVCNGFSAAGLPLSMQIVGRPFEDHVALQVGDAFEKATGFRSVRPAFATGPALAAQ
jgi:aspartyl-tRNA(Asn)/glutamyl-tRNA(Gln) amidotransferase subunit A